jgi:hypothetical protein
MASAASRTQSPGPYHCPARRPITLTPTGAIRIRRRPLIFVLGIWPSAYHEISFHEVNLSRTGYDWRRRRWESRTMRWHDAITSRPFHQSRLGRWASLCCVPTRPGLQACCCRQYQRVTLSSPAEPAHRHQQRRLARWVLATTEYAERERILLSPRRLHSSNPYPLRNLFLFLDRLPAPPLPTHPPARLPSSLPFLPGATRRQAPKIFGCHHHHHGGRVLEGPPPHVRHKGAARAGHRPGASTVLIAVQRTACPTRPRPIIRFGAIAVPITRSALLSSCSSSPLPFPPASAVDSARGVARPV